MLTTIVEEHPIILVVDDLHLADEASLAVLHLVMRRARGQTIMVVLIARPGELLHSPQAARLRESGESLGICEVELAPLSPEESGDLLTALVPSDERQPSASTRRALLRAAGGFPMVLELLDAGLAGQRRPVARAGGGRDDGGTGREYSGRPSRIATSSHVFCARSIPGPTTSSTSPLCWATGSMTSRCTV